MVLKSGSFWFRILILGLQISFALNSSLTLPRAWLLVLQISPWLKFLSLVIKLVLEKLSTKKFIISSTLISHIYTNNNYCKKIAFLSAFVMSKTYIFLLSGIWHCSWTLQRYIIHSSISWKYWRNFLHWQWGFIRHLFPYIKIDLTNIWRFKSSRFCKFSIFLYYFLHRYRKLYSNRTMQHCPSINWSKTAIVHFVLTMKLSTIFV